MPPPLLPPSFASKKARIIANLALPASEYDDLSPKGSVDEGIRDLIEGINAQEGWVTTSSCAGRVSVFVEGRRDVDGKLEKIVGGKEGWERKGVGADGSEEREPRGEGKEEEEDEEEFENEEVGSVKAAGVGGKGGGGRWLFVSHEPVDGLKEQGVTKLLGMHEMGDVQQYVEKAEASKSFAEDRLIHFKFEPMILHVLTASLAHAQRILNAALQAGFRESGALKLISTTSQGPTPMVAVRSTGLALDSIVGRLDAGDKAVCITSETYLRGLLALASDRFAENSKRITRFRNLLLGENTTKTSISSMKEPNIGEWEDKAARRERMRKEGLKKRDELMRGSDDAERPDRETVTDSGEDNDEKKGEYTQPEQNYGTHRIGD